jgi:hypothetical protein
MAVEAAKIVINVSAEGTQQAAAGLGKVDEKVGGINETIKQLVAGGAIVAAAKAMIDFSANVTKAFGIAETATVRLNAVAQMKGLDGGAARFKKLAAEMQTLTGVSDEVVQNISAELLAQGKSEAMTRKMIKAAADLSAVTGDDLNTSVEMLNRSLSGQAGMLARTNPELKSLTEEQLKSGAAIDLIAQKYTGMAQSMSGTIEVSNKLRDETFGDLAETMGQFLAPAVTLVNQAFTNMALTGIEIMNFVNQMPAPIKLLVTGMTALAAITAGLAIAQAAGLAVTIKKTIADGIQIAKTAAQTVAMWLQYAAQMAVNAAVAVGVPSQWAAIAAATALTVAVVATAAALSSQADEMNGVDKSAKDVRTTLSGLQTVYGDLIAKAKAWDAARKASQSASEKQLETERKYKDLFLETSVARRNLATFEKVGLITRQDYLNQLIEQEKKLLEATIERGKAEGSPELFVENAQRSRDAIAAMQAELQALKDAELEGAKQLTTERNASEVGYRAEVSETTEKVIDAEELRRDQFAQTFARLNEHFDEYGESIEDTEGAWLESLQNITSEYQYMFDQVSQMFGSIDKIAQNMSDAQIMRIDEEEERINRANDYIIQGMIARGATDEEIAAAKAQIDEDDKARALEFEATKKKLERAGAVRAKAFAVFQATLQVPLLVMQGMKAGFEMGGWPGAIAGGIAGGLQGGLQLAAAASTPIPSAQFGGEFMVPPGFSGDSGLVRVNSGEKVSVEPVRSSDDSPKSVVVQIGQRDFEGYLQEVLNSGRVTIRRQGVVRYA